MYGFHGLHYQIIEKICHACDRRRRTESGKKSSILLDQVVQVVRIVWVKRVLGWSEWSRWSRWSDWSGSSAQMICIQEIYGFRGMNHQTVEMSCPWHTGDKWTNRGKWKTEQYSGGRPKIAKRSQKKHHVSCQDYSWKTKNCKNLPLFSPQFCSYLLSFNKQTNVEANGNDVEQQCIGMAWPQCTTITTTDI